MANRNMEHMELREQYDQERATEAFLYEIDRINDFYFTFGYFRHDHYQVYKEARFVQARASQQGQATDPHRVADQAAEAVARAISRAARAKAVADMAFQQALNAIVEANEALDQTSSDNGASDIGVQDNNGVHNNGVHNNGVHNNGVHNNGVKNSAYGNNTYNYHGNTYKINNFSAIYNNNNAATTGVGYGYEAHDPSGGSRESRRLFLRDFAGRVVYFNSGSSNSAQASSSDPGLAFNEDRLIP